MKIVSKISPVQHYQWGNHCEAWNLVDEAALSVKLESMPPHTAEELHFHEKAQQFFYILKGSAVFEIDGERTRITEGEGILIKAGQVHRILNEENETLEFILSAQPSTAADRFNVEEQF